MGRRAAGKKTPGVPHDPAAERPDDDAITRWAAEFMFDQVRAGAAPDAIVRMLEEKGVDRAEAAELVEARYSAMEAAAAAERWNPRALAITSVAALAAALVGGIAWTWLVRTTDYEVGFFAWAIGLLAGVAVLLASRQRRGVPLQLIAVAASVVGIVLGKYLTYVYDVREFVADEAGPALAGEVTPFSPDMMRTFAEDVNAILTAYDFLWLGLAVVTAWQVPRRRAREPDDGDSFA